jgi:hypothetical protein
MASFVDLPLDIVSMIAVRAGVKGWLRLARCCKKFAPMAVDKTRQRVILGALTVMMKNCEGNKEWTVNGKMHRDGDKPALIYPGGTSCWFKYGELHRDGDKPAIIFADGSRNWYKHGKRHRDGDEPAIIYADGDREWYKHGVRHREGNKPAFISTKRCYWYKHGVKYYPKRRRLE